MHVFGLGTNKIMRDPFFKIFEKKFQIFSIGAWGNMRIHKRAPRAACTLPEALSILLNVMSAYTKRVTSTLECIITIFLSTFWNICRLFRRRISVGAFTTTLRKLLPLLSLFLMSTDGCKKNTVCLGISSVFLKAGT